MDKFFDIVDIVLLLLAALSILTWTIVLVKAYDFWRDSRRNAIFNAELGKLAQIRDISNILPREASTLTEIAMAGVTELLSLEKSASTLDFKDRKEMLHHALRHKFILPNHA